MTLIQLYTIPEVARMLEMTEGGVRVMVSRNRLKPTVRQGDKGAPRHLFDQAAIDIYLLTYSRFAPHTCRHCHRIVPSVPTGGAREFCDDDCKQEVARRRKRGVPDDYVDPRVGRFLRVPAVCAHCGSDYLTASSRGRFCSSTCRTKAFFVRHDIDPHSYNNKGQQRVHERTLR